MIPLHGGDAPPLRFDDASMWAWLVAAGLLAAAVVALGRTRAWRSVAPIMLAVLLVTESLHVVGAWMASDESGWSRLGASASSICAIVVAGVALVRPLRTDAWRSAPAVLVAGIFMTIAGGIADLSTLSSSELATTLPTWVAHLTVTAALGLGSGLVIASAQRLATPKVSERRG